MKPIISELHKTILNSALRGELTDCNTDEWDSGPLGEFLVLNYGKGIAKEDRHKDGKYPVYGANGILGRTDKLMIDEPAVIIGRKGSAGAVKLVPPNFWPSDVTYYVLAGDRFDINFLYYLISSLDLEKLAIGIKPGINRKYVYKKEIAIPSLSEQKEIVTDIENLFFLCAQLEAKSDDLLIVINKLKQTTYNLSLEGKLVNQDENDEPAITLLEKTKTRKIMKPIADKEKLMDLPKGWEWVRLGQIVELVNGKGFKKTEWSQDGLPIVRIQNLNNLDASFNKASVTTEDRYHIDNGQLLLSWSGTPGTSFGAFIWDRGPALLNQHIFRVEFSEKYINKEFLNNLLNVRLFEMLSQAIGGVGLQHLRKPQLENIVIGLPPKNEQDRIISKLNDVMSLCSKLEAALIFANVLSKNVEAKEPNINVAFNIQQSIAALLNSGFQKGEMAIAKVIYMVQEIYGIPIGLVFTRQNFGPYDGKVKKAFISGVRNNNFFVNKGTADRPYYALGEGGKKILKYSIATATEDSLKDLLPKIKSADSASIERLATVCKVIQDNNTIDNIVVQRKVAEWKPDKFTEAQIDKSLEFIKANSWDERLLSDS